MLRTIDAPLGDRLLNELGLVLCMHLQAECIAVHPELSETELEYTMTCRFGHWLGTSWALSRGHTASNLIKKLKQLVCKSDYYR